MGIAIIDAIPEALAPPMGGEIPREHLGDLAIMSEYTGVHG